MSNVYVVIPIFNGWAMTHNLLWNLYRKERENIEMILVMDNASTDPEVATGLNWWRAEWKEKSDPLKVISITNAENIGFTLNSNDGLRYICNEVADVEPNDIVILLSNDVQVNGKFISQIKDIIEQTPKSLVGGILYSNSTGWNEFNGQVFPYIEGWVLATTIQNWKELDYFDELYAPACFEDIDLSTKALKLGYELIALNNPGLHHMVGQTIKYSPERDALTKINQQKFREKWIGK
jgi:GT2 family glycosyltransferase